MNNRERLFFKPARTFQESRNFVLTSANEFEGKRNSASLTASNPFSSVEMKVSEFTHEQKEALLDIIILAMYADGYLAKSEDERIHGLLTSLGFTTKFDRDKQYDASVSRVSRQSQTPEAARGHAKTLARKFSTREQRQKVKELLDQVVVTDPQIASQENNLFSVVSRELRE